MNDVKAPDTNLVLTTVKCNFLHTCPFAQVEQDCSVHVEAVRRQIEAALYGAAFEVRSAHIHQEQVIRA
jgi:hypothetical protein